MGDSFRMSSCLAFCFMDFFGLHFLTLKVAWFYLNFSSQSLQKMDAFWVLWNLFHSPEVPLPVALAGLSQKSLLLDPWHQDRNLLEMNTPRLLFIEMFATPGSLWMESLRKPSDTLLLRGPTSLTLAKKYSSQAFQGSHTVECRRKYLFAEAYMICLGPSWTVPLALTLKHHRSRTK